MIAYEIPMVWQVLNSKVMFQELRRMFSQYNHGSSEFHISLLSNNASEFIQVFGNNIIHSRYFFFSFQTWIADVVASYSSNRSKSLTKLN